MPSHGELVERALGYPYAAPRESFVQSGGRTLPLGAVDVDLDGRIPLLAYGSNAAPEALRRKLAGAAEPVPAIRALLHDFDVVYSAHVSAYGAVPATLWRSAGAELPVFVIHLTDAQLSAIAATEPNYERERLEGVVCTLEDGTPAGDLTAYVSRHGPLLRRGSPVAVAEVETRGRTLSAMGQRAAIDAVRRAVCPGSDLESFIVEAATYPELPPRWTAALRSNGGEAAEGDPGEQAIGDDQHRQVGQRPADVGPGGVERGGHRL